ncbi:MAG TPA: class I SAM-dependent methyltransferase [Gaiellaceae bacterium]|nr:class I SAM-dependent methyltransferase [Gaiellaceae bacterium]
MDAADFQGPAGNATDKYGSSNPLARWLVGRFVREVEVAVRELGPGSILDVGCGEGIVTERLARATGARTVGVDIGAERLRAEWRRRDAGLVSFVEASAYALPYADDAFECVCALEVLEHLERPDTALAELARVARASLVLSVPNEPLWRAVHLLAGRDVRRLGDTPGHINHWSSRRFAALVARYALVSRVRRPFPWTLIVARPRG